MQLINDLKERNLLSDVQEQQWNSLIAIIRQYEDCIVACSGGIDSMLLATIAHNLHGQKCVIFHAISPAVPEADTKRVMEYANKYGWNQITKRTGEFENEAYLSNPVNRCYFCKSHLYRTIIAIHESVTGRIYGSAGIFSGTNVDDLGEFRPGLEAAKEHGVIHPYVEAGIGKKDIRLFARCMGLVFADLPASPCLASRVYTGTRVTEERLRAVYYAETELKKMTQFQVVRCRIRESQMIVEVSGEDRKKMRMGTILRLRQSVVQKFPFISDVFLDQNDYKPGRAFTRQVKRGVKGRYVSEEYN